MVHDKYINERNVKTMNQLLDDIRKDAIKCADVARCSNPSWYDSEFDVFKAIGTILTLAEIVQNEGLFAMDDFLDTADDSLPNCNYFKKIGHLVTKATEPELIEEIGTNIYWTNGYSKFHALVAYTYLRGLLMIQAGHHVHYIQDVLLSVLTGKELELYKESEYKWVETEKSYKDYRVEFKDNTTQSFINYINKSYETMSDCEFERFLELTNNSDIVVPLPYLTDNAEQRIFDSIPETLQKMYIEDAKFQQYVGESQLREVLLKLIANIAIVKMG